MPFLYISLGVIAVLFLIYMFSHIHQKKVSDEIQNETETMMSKFGKVSKEHQHTYVTIAGITYQVIYVYVPLRAELTINSTTIWEVRESGKSRLIHQGHLLASPKPKIMIIYPASQVIKRYINENEMEFVKYNKMFYNMYVCRYSEVSTLLEELADA